VDAVTTAGAAEGRRERRKRELRARIYATARRLFREQGVAATTVEQIAAATDIAPATFFNHFQSKQALLGEMTSEVVDHLQGLIEQRLLRPGSAQARIRAFADQAANEIHEARSAARDVLLEFMRTRTRPGEAAPHLARVHGPFAKILREGQAKGEVRTDLDAPFLAEMVAGAFKRRRDSLDERPGLPARATLPAGRRLPRRRDPAGGEGAARGGWPPRTSAGRIVTSAVGTLDRAVLDAGTDLVGRHPEERAEDVVVVLADHAAGASRAHRGRGEAERHARRDDAALLEMLHLLEEGPGGQLPVRTCQILDVLHHAGRDAGILEERHDGVVRTGAGPALDEAIELVGMGEPARAIGEARVGLPGRLADGVAEAAPLGLVADGDHAPAIVALAAVAAVRREAPGTVPETRRLDPVREPLHHHVADGRDRRLELGQVDELSTPVRWQWSSAHMTAKSPWSAVSTSGYAYCVIVHSRSGNPESVPRPDSASMFGPQVT
jgi:AcrR family transcriptional regulator